MRSDTPTKIVITKCEKQARQSHSNLLPNTIHELVRPPKGEPRNFTDDGVWVMGAEGEPVKVLFGEFTLHWEYIYYSRMRRTKFKRFKMKRTK